MNTTSNMLLRINKQSRILLKSLIKENKNDSANCIITILSYVNNAIKEVRLSYKFNIDYSNEKYKKIIQLSDPDCDQCINKYVYYYDEKINDMTVYIKMPRT
jgi:ribosomal protein L6P/L9E